MTAHGNSLQPSVPSHKPKIQFALVLMAAVSFHLAFSSPLLAPLIVVYLGCLVELTRAHSARLAFYSGLAIGFLVFAPKLAFFYTIFGPAAVPLWLVLAFWHALFVVTAQRLRSVFPSTSAIFLIPILWTGFEYFRSELYPLKFSWLTPAFAFGPTAALHFLGIYGITFVLLLFVAVVSLLPRRPRIFTSITLVVALFAVLQLSNRNPVALAPNAPTLKIAGIQLEFPVELEVPSKLDLLKQKYPEADLYVLSEYTFDGPVPNCVRAWCKRNSKYLVAGGKDPAPNNNYYNTAFVIDPNGEIIFQQAKAVPIQFFKDGLPAPKQKIWNSPWGKIGLCVCYDLSYTRVVDRLIRQGAQIIINPTMDVADWGSAQHQLHSRIPPMRAAEYGIPIFRLASSGISQAINSHGQVLSIAPFPGDEATLAATFSLNVHSTLPLDRLLAPITTLVTALSIVFISVRRMMDVVVPARRGCTKHPSRTNCAWTHDGRPESLASWSAATGRRFGFGARQTDISGQPTISG
jgi:apolipoprotein N-acyltransferase